VREFFRAGHERRKLPEFCFSVEGKKCAAARGRVICYPFCVIGKQRKGVIAHLTRVGSRFTGIWLFGRPDRSKIGTVRGIAALFLTLLFVVPASVFSEMSAGDYLNRANDERKNRNFKEAILDYDRALELDPQIAEGYVDRALARIELNDSQAALADLDRAIQFDPKLDRAYLARGGLKRRKGDVPGALQDYNKAIELNPTSASAYDARGNALWDQGDLSESIADFDRAIERDPNYVPAYQHRAMIRQRQGDAEGATADYNKALEFDPKLAAAYFGRAAIESARADADKAIEDYNRGLELDPYRGDAYLARGALFYDKRRWAEAVADFRKSCELAREREPYTRLYIWAARAHMRQRRVANKELVDYFDKLPLPSPTPKPLRGQALGSVTDTLLQELYPSATMSSSKKTRSDFVAAYWPVAIARFLRGRSSETALFEAELPRRFRRPSGFHSCDTWFFVGVKYLADGDNAKAADCFRKCLTADHKNELECAFAQAELMELEKLNGASRDERHRR
jgi:tetratricopeptide (TPR) repeat protein